MREGYADIALAIKFGVAIPLVIVTRHWRRVIENKEGILFLDRCHWEREGQQIQTFVHSLWNADWDNHRYVRIGPFDTGTSSGEMRGGWHDDPFGFEQCWRADDYSPIARWFGEEKRKRRFNN
jgi:hypothetical protein